MASSGGVEAVPDHQAVELEQRPAEARDGGESGSPAAATTTEGSRPMLLLQEQQHGDEAVVAPEQQSYAEVPASEEEPTKPQQETPVAEEEVVEPDDEEMSTRERLKRHRREMAGRVWVPRCGGRRRCSRTRWTAPSLTARWCRRACTRRAGHSSPSAARTPRTGRRRPPPPDPACCGCPRAAPDRVILLSTFH